MNSDLNSSPMTSAQSWIVENISSLISSNNDDENDCTLTLNETSTGLKSKSLTPLISCDFEVERSRTIVDDYLQAERIPKRPFSPEIVFENNRQTEQMNIFYNNQKIVSFFINTKNH